MGDWFPLYRMIGGVLRHEIGLDHPSHEYWVGQGDDDDDDDVNILSSIINYLKWKIFETGSGYTCLQFKFTTMILRRLE